MRTLSFVLVTVTLAGCGSGEPAPAEVATAALHADGGALYPPGARPFGLSMEAWGDIFWDWLYAIPADENPMLDDSGADCGVAQFGPVWFLPSVIDPGGTASFARSCTVPRDRALLVNLSGVLNDFPCPDPTFAPAPGQSLFDFLSTGAAQIVDNVNLVTLSLDGGPAQSMLDRRVTSEHLFLIDGATSLATVLDGCITGKPQPAVADGYFAMVKPLARGAHTLVERATDTHGTDLTLTYEITVP